MTNLLTEKQCDPVTLKNSQQGQWGTGNFLLSFKGGFKRLKIKNFLGKVLDMCDFFSRKKIDFLKIVWEGDADVRLLGVTDIKFKARFLFGRNPLQETCPYRCIFNRSYPRTRICDSSMFFQRYQTYFPKWWVSLDMFGWSEKNPI